MKRIIIHWTAGTHTPSDLDKEHYHWIIDGAGALHPGKWPISANAKPVSGAYAAHTLNCNTGSIGVAVSAMAGAQESPFVAGPYPITPDQVSALVALCRDLAAKYGIPVSRETVLSHAEVQPTLGIKQRGKWDIAWLPGMAKPGNPVHVGDHMRGLMMAAPPARPEVEPTTTTPLVVRGVASEPLQTEPKQVMGSTAAFVALALAVAGAAAGAWSWFLGLFN